MKQNPKPSKDVIAAFSRWGQTPLYDWLANNFDRLPNYKRRETSWTEMAEAVNALGIKGRDPDKPVNPAMIRWTYKKVLADRQAAAA